MDDRENLNDEIFKQLIREAIIENQYGIFEEPSVEEDGKKLAKEYLMPAIVLAEESMGPIDTDVAIYATSAILCHFIIDSRDGNIEKAAEDLENLAKNYTEYWRELRANTPE